VLTARNEHPERDPTTAGEADASKAANGPMPPWNSLKYDSHHSREAYNESVRLVA